MTQPSPVTQGYLEDRIRRMFATPSPRDLVLPEPWQVIDELAKVLAANSPDSAIFPPLQCSTDVRLPTPLASYHLATIRKMFCPIRTCHGEGLGVLDMATRRIVFTDSSHKHHPMMPALEKRFKILVPGLEVADRQYHAASLNRVPANRKWEYYAQILCCNVLGVPIPHQLPLLSLVELQVLTPALAIGVCAGSSWALAYSQEVINARHSTPTSSFIRYGSPALLRAASPFAIMGVEELSNPPPPTPTPPPVSIVDFDPDTLQVTLEEGELESFPEQLPEKKTCGGATYRGSSRH